MVGIVGPPDSGKTAALVSLYLLLSHGRLQGFEYADSRSLMAFDEISRGARRWAGEMPQQMTPHTELSDDRAAGFLHLRIRAVPDNVPIDFLLPDLPGEWSTAMVEQSRHDRLAFLQRADVIWLMVDGGRLSSPTQRQGAIHRTRLYLQRLKEFFPDLPRVILVVTRADLGTANEKTLQAILNEGVALGIEISVQTISSFSANEEVPAGTGIAELIVASMGRQADAAAFWPSSSDNIGRAIGNVGRGGVEI
ncbi:TRAFAC clade GTPase domain-containing protein [Agrobacterium pusense]|uniref:TRAFAC clade GTPase domain-containing protein n=1 Tax=Agrobacterium pusense TaxID=648995 RepID=UPI003FD50518